MQQTGDTQVSTQDNGIQNNKDNRNTEDSGETTKNGTVPGPGDDNSRTRDEVNKNNHASVETLIKLGEDFLDAAFAGDIDDMIGLSSDAMADDIEKNPKKYLGTKPDYNIDKIDTSIKALGEGKYLVQSSVSAAKKNDEAKKLYNFKYSATIEKVNDDYYIIDFKKDSK